MKFAKVICFWVLLIGIGTTGVTYLPLALAQRSHRKPVVAFAPSPRWEYSADRIKPSKITFTKDTIFLYAQYDGSKIVALERATGKERWRYEEPRLSIRPPGMAEQWSSVFSAEGNLLVAQIIQTEKVIDATEKIGYRTESQFLVRGMDARTSSTRWELTAERLGYSSSTPIRLIDVYGGEIVAIAVEQKIILVETATGRQLSPPTKPDSILLRYVAMVTGSDYVLLAPQYGRGLWQLLHLETGEVSSTVSGGGTAAAYVSGHLVCYVDSDNDAPGGSLLPKWLEAFDQQGKKVWQFPKTITYRDDVFPTPESTIRYFCPLPTVGIILTAT